MWWLNKKYFSCLITSRTEKSYYQSYCQSQRNCATERSLWGVTFGDQLKQLNPLCITESTVAEDWSRTTAEQAEI